jgi:hypothetical protein
VFQAYTTTVLLGHHQGKLKELDGKESKLNDSQRRFASLWILALWCNQESPEPTEFEGKVRPLGAVRGWQQGGNLPQAPSDLLVHARVLASGSTELQRSSASVSRRSC